MDSPRPSTSRSPIALAIGLAVFVLALWPHVARLSHPSVYGDDLGRIWCLEALPTARVLSTPFNEHVAPFFDAVSALSWAVAGGNLTRVARVFTAAAFIPFVLTIVALAGLARRDLGSWPRSVIVVAIFAVAPVHVVETVWWYSGSNHMWAVLWTILALWYSGRPGHFASIGTFACVAIAPACSAMGLVAAPACVLYAMAGRSPRVGRIVAAASLGLLTYGLVASLLGLLPAVIHGRSQSGDPIVGILAALQAPTAVLLPALLGLRPVDSALAAIWEIGVTILLSIAVLAWSWKRPERGFVVAGLWFTLAAYLLIYPFRAVGGTESMFRVARYHLFPQLGLAMILGSLCGPLLAGPRGGRNALAAVVAIVILHSPRMISESSLYDFPSQALTLSAIEHAGAICRDEGITGPQAVAALEPIKPHWMAFDQSYANLARLIGPIAGTGSGRPRLPDTEVRSHLLASLGPEDRQGLFGGMDVTPYLVPTTRIPRGESRDLESSPIGSAGMTPTGPPGHYESQGWPSYVEFRLNASASEVARARYLCVPLVAREPGVELWWSDDSGQWSEGRSVAWKPRPGDLPGEQLAVPLDRLPHWSGAEVRRVRVRFRFPGPVRLGPPALRL